MDIANTDDLGASKDKVVQMVGVAMDGIDCCAADVRVVQETLARGDASDASQRASWAKDVCLTTVGLVATPAILSHRMYLSISFRKSTPP